TFIKQLAKQRNEYRDKNDSMEDELEQLRFDNEQLRNRVSFLEDMLADYLEHKDDRDKSDEYISELSGTIDAARSEMTSYRKCLEELRGQLKDTLALSSDALDRADVSAERIMGLLESNPVPSDGLGTGEDISTEDKDGTQDI
ncbi:MAG: hypothetical protein IJ072_06480, partial [Oscillospiraceae bacterium]|nr:hypothetical protein [Oscillospiraceae bacterium]